MQRLSPFATEPLSGEQICDSPATVFALHKLGRASDGLASQFWL
jgi:hypothetical protein